MYTDEKILKNIQQTIHKFIKWIIHHVNSFQNARLVLTSKNNKIHHANWKKGKQKHTWLSRRHRRSIWQNATSFPVRSLQKKAAWTSLNSEQQHIPPKNGSRPKMCAGTTTIPQNAEGSSQDSEARKRNQEHTGHKGEVKPSTPWYHPVCRKPWELQKLLVLTRV